MSTALCWAVMQLLPKTAFPFFQTLPDAHYLDNAATTQVPADVIVAMQEALTQRGNPGRGSHRLAVQAQAKLEEARHAVAEFIQARPSEVVFTKGTTDGLHLFVESLLPLLAPGDAVALSLAEHHASLLAWHKTTTQGIRLKGIPLQEGVLTVENVCAIVTSRTKVLAIQHVSNVTGVIHPLREIVHAVRARFPEIIIVVDGAQAIAHLSVDVHELDVDAYVFSGHKMYGPDGVGVLYIHERLHARLRAARLGGGGVKSVHTYEVDGEMQVQAEPVSGIMHFESGTLNITAIIGLARAVDILRRVGVEALRTHEQELRTMFMTYLEGHSEFEVVSPPSFRAMVGIVSFRLRAGSVAELEHLFAEAQIFIRYGSHCAMPLTDVLGGETFRVSFGCYNDISDVQAIIEFMERFRKTVPPPTSELILRDCEISSIRGQSLEAIFQTIIATITDVRETSVVIMAGHCLGIPDREKNTFIPSIPSLLRPDLQPLLKEFGMEHFSSLSWGMGCALVARLKRAGVHAQLLPIVNDTTGINELRQQVDERQRKTAEEYRRELQKSFSGEKGLPEAYLAVLAANNLFLTDVLKTPEGYFVGEHGLRKRFHQNFVHRNKEALRGLVEYGVDQHGTFDLQLPIFGERTPRACTFDTFQSKTGGRFCVVEVSQYLAELFGQIDEDHFARLPARMKCPLVTNSHQILLMLTPAMCNNAVNQGGELYLRLMRAPSLESSMQIFQLSIGPRAFSLEGLEIAVTRLR